MLQYLGSELALNAQGVLTLKLGTGMHQASGQLAISGKDQQARRLQIQATDTDPALTFEARVSFVLGADLSVRRLKFEAVDEFDSNDETDPIARFDANFAFMTAELSRLLRALDVVFVESA